MVQGGDPTLRCRGRRGNRRAIWQLGLAAALIPLGAQTASAQADPSFPATAATTDLPGPAGSAGQGASPGSSIRAFPSPTLPQRQPGSLLPFTGSPAAGNLHGDTASSLAVPLERTARNFTVTPALGLAEEYTSNALATGARGHGYDFVTLIQPSLSVSGVSTRLQGSLAYHPEVDLYARNFSSSRVNQNFGGNLLATLLPGTVFLDLRAFGGVTTNGAGGSYGTNNSSSSNQTQTLAFAASPYALRRFGDWGTGEVGASLQRSSSSGVGGTNATTTTATDPFFTSGNQTLTTYSAHAGFQTGQAFDRYNGTALLYASQNTGTGVLANSARSTATIDNGYGVTRLFTLLGRVGYEHIRYSGTSPVRIDDAVWDAGFRLTLGPESSVEARYGHHDGFNALLVDASLQLTARTRLYGRYSEGLNTDAEQLQSALASSDFDQLGNPVDHTSGAPLLLATSALSARKTTSIARSACR